MKLQVQCLAEEQHAQRQKFTLLKTFIANVIEQHISNQIRCIIKTISEYSTVQFLLEYKILLYLLAKDAGRTTSSFFFKWKISSKNTWFSESLEQTYELLDLFFFLRFIHWLYDEDGTVMWFKDSKTSIGAFACQVIPPIVSFPYLLCRAAVLWCKRMGAHLRVCVLIFSSFWSCRFLMQWCQREINSMHLCVLACNVYFHSFLPFLFWERCECVSCPNET